MAVLPFITSSYAQVIYVFGTKSFSDVPAEYHEPVKILAADRYTVPPWGYPPDNTYRQLNIALNNGWITQQEYDETIAYVPPR